MQTAANSDADLVNVCNETVALEEEIERGCSDNRAAELGERRDALLWQMMEMPVNAEAGLRAKAAAVAKRYHWPRRVADMEICDELVASLLRNLGAAAPGRLA